MKTGSRGVFWRSTAAAWRSITGGPRVRVVPTQRFLVCKGDDGMSERNKFRIQRSLGIELPGLGKPGALEKRNYPPGQHGRLHKRKVTQFGAELREKQKLLFHYGLREEQLNIVIRPGVARSIASARQLASHGHILVNGRGQTIGSMVLRIGEQIHLSDRAKQMTAIKKAREAPRLNLPSYLQFDDPSTKESGTLHSLPDSAHVPFEINAAQVAEYYAKRGV